MPECPNCKHKNNYWDVKLMDRTHLRTDPFICIKGCTHEEQDCNGNNQIKRTEMYGCPNCHIVFWGEDW